MRTTVTLDPDVERLIKDAMRERGISFKEALNEAARIGLRGKGPKRAQTSFKTFAWERHKSSVGTKRWRLQMQSRTKNSAESSPCVNDPCRREPPDLRSKPGRPAKPEGEALAGNSLIRTGNRRFPVECSSRVPSSYDPAGLTVTPCRWIRPSICSPHGWICPPRLSCIPVRATWRFCASYSNL